MDMALGVLPLLPLALHLWYQSHAPVVSSVLPAVLVAARAINMLGLSPAPRFAALMRFI